MVRQGRSTQRLIAGLVAATLVLLVAILVLGVLSTQRLTEIVTDQFNAQQLTIARGVAQNIETRFQSLRTQLLTLADFARASDRAGAARLLARQGWPAGSGVLELRLYSGSGVLLASSAARPEGLGPELPRTLAAVQATHPGEALTGECFRTTPGGRWRQLVATLVSPGSSGSSLVAVLDPIGIAGSAAGPVRSGKTGYAYVLNHQGYFLTHYEKQFVGQDAFKARAGKNPLISFERINRIQKDYMLQGREGTSWYLSGWHREAKGQIRKLIAYTPVRLDHGNFWSVAVVAPESEVGGLIGSLQLEQWLLAGLAVLIVVAGFGAAVHFAIRWSALLAIEVDHKTAALRQSESALRAERDKVTESYQQLVEAQDRLIRSERLAAIGEAAAKVCHEIKNPLMVIGGFSKQLLRQASGEGKERDKLAIIVAEVERLEMMMIEVGDFTKPTQLNKRLLEPAELLQQVYDMMAEEMASRQIDFSLSADASLPQVSCDPEKMKQVLINLVKNAAEAMPEGGKLRLVGRRERRWVCLDIIDSGKGIAAEDLESIFTPFFTTKKGGSGLGLSVCHKLVQDHGGRIEVRSAVGGGSTFSVLLPVEAAAREAKTKGQPTEELPLAERTQGSNAT